MRRIVITGGLGYIGTQLCALYASQRAAHVTVVDNRFLPDKVADLTRWGIAYHQGDILNRSLIQELLGGADVVYHLAGITDVAYTQTEADPVKDAAINKVAKEGSMNVLGAMPTRARIVFPSTHVVFEGLSEPEFDIEEEKKTCAILTYARGKQWFEEQLMAQEKEFVVLRLGSAYGYGGSSMRVGIMPNLFAKITSQGGIIKLFGGGEQHKSLVDVRDVARAMQFLAERKEAGKEVFHCTKENVTVREVAEMCKGIDPGVQLVRTDDEVPNKGYTLSNKKLLKAGFSFEHRVEDSLAEMISLWKTRNT